MTLTDSHIFYQALDSYWDIANQDQRDQKINSLVLQHPKAEMRLKTIDYLKNKKESERYVSALEKARFDQGTAKWNVARAASTILVELGRLDPSLVEPISYEAPRQRASSAKASSSPRKFSEINIQGLREKVESAKAKLEGNDDDLAGLTPKIQKDLAKVYFTPEKIFTEPFSHIDEVPYEDNFGLLGYNTLENGLSFLGVSAWDGEDGTPPLFFIIYWDGQALRGYIPIEGNMWNTDISRGFGYDRASDLINIKKRFPGNDDLTEIDYYEDILGLTYDATKLRADILGRFAKK